MYNFNPQSTLLKCICLLSLVLNLNNNCLGQAGRVYTVAGGGMSDAIEEPATNTKIHGFKCPIGMDGAGNYYLSDNFLRVIRKVDRGTGIIKDIVGNRSSTVYTDGLPATSVGLGTVNGIYITEIGDIYLCESNIIRKVSVHTGIIKNVAGGGSSTADNIPATSASISTNGVYVDNADNIYFATDNKIKKVNGSTGIITSVAGNGISGYLGDGGPATAAKLHRSCKMIGMDNFKNLYIIDSSVNGNVVRKINNATGVINTIAGGDTSLLDCIPATNAKLDYFYYCSVDGNGNIFACVQGDFIKRVDATTGIICKIALDPYGTFYEGVPALSTYIVPDAIFTNPSTSEIIFMGNPGFSYDRLFKFSYSPLIPFSTSATDSFYTNVEKRCSGPKLTVRTKTFRSGMRVRTDFGDGNYDTASINRSWSGIGGFALVNHNYTTNRPYSIIQVLDSAGIPLDTITTAYNHVFCSDMSVSFFNDMDADCTKDTTEPYIMQQVLTEVDSNNVPIDTVVATSGLHYRAFGNPNDIYRFKVIATPSGLVTSCPTTGFIYDTLRAGVTTNAPRKMALSCAATSNIDLEARAFVPVTRPNSQWGHLYLGNNYCPPANGLVTLNFNPAYAYAGIASSTPTSTTSTSLTWNLSALTSIAASPTDIYYELWHNSAMPYPRDGDTVISTVTITPTSGPPDVNTANNVMVRVDTIHTSCDPNAMEVVPGCFRNDTTFLCTIHFENIGSAPAENIYVMDTLSRYFDPSSIQIKMSTHPMFVTKYVAGGNTIMKFDFPNINLADSSDHLHRDGMLMYTIKNKPSLLGGLVLKSQAGIYFDYNDVLMTNVANVTVGCPWPLSTDDISAKNKVVTLYPNPATDELTINSPANQYEHLTISNMLGERIMSLNLPKPTTTIDISTLPTGMYIVTLYGSKGSEVKKFVKE